MYHKLISKPTSLALLASCLLLSACGQTGPLYLPPPADSKPKQTQPAPAKASVAKQSTKSSKAS